MVSIGRDVAVAKPRGYSIKQSIILNKPVCTVEKFVRDRRSIEVLNCNDLAYRSSRASSRKARLKTLNSFTKFAVVSNNLGVLGVKVHQVTVDDIAVALD